jgi:hypothetical protein
VQNQKVPGQSAQPAAGASIPNNSDSQLNDNSANPAAGDNAGQPNTQATVPPAGQQPGDRGDQLNKENPAGESAFTTISGNRRKTQGGEPVLPGNAITPGNGAGKLLNATGARKEPQPDTDQPLTTNNNNSLLAPPAADDNFGFIEPYQQNHLQAGSTIPTEIPHIDGSMNMLDKKVVAHHYGQFKSVIICPSDKNRNTDWFLEAYLSPDLAFRSITNNTASQAYLLRKDSSESMRVGYTAGIRLVKPITDNFLVKAGVQFTQMNQKYVYRTENEVKTITVVSTRTIIRAPGDTVIIRDTSVLQQIGFKNNTVINRFRTIDVPVMVGYQFGNEDLKIGVNAGVVFNMSSWYEGVMLRQFTGHCAYHQGQQ